MGDQITKEQINALREIDTPTICNLIEMAKPSRRGYGYTVEHLHCLFPDMKPIVGYAKTATMRAKQPSRYSPEEYLGIRNSYFDYLDQGASPKISIVQDLDERPGYGAFWGEVFSACHKALGCVGAVTNGSIRDLDMIADDFQLLAGVIAPSHAYIHIVDWSCEVNVHGMVVQDSDLIHADRHGAVVIPEDVLAEIIDALDLMLRREKVILDVARGSDFSVEKLKDAWKRSSEIKE